jgi:nucleoside 2-deoxyribosyltransferase
MALKCFIAMAFDRKDTDRLYDKTIKPIFKQKGISQFRVDRSNRNDDIDDQILSELQKCDFVIADLTYARPSVYFEAGIAQGRPVPVIYTCRRDHFRHQPHDEHGNFRVHFDLQMKPIIPWTDPTSVSFSRRLEKRIASVIRPLVHQQQLSRAEETERHNFSTFSLSKKLQRVREIYENTVHYHGFRSKSFERFAWNRKKGALLVTEPYFDNIFTKKEITAVLVYYGPSGMRDTREVIEEQLIGKRFPKVIERHVFLCSLRRVPESRVTAALSRYKVIKTADEILATCDSKFSFQREKQAPRGSKLSVLQESITLPAKDYVHVISEIISEHQFKNRLNNTMKSIGRKI